MSQRRDAARARELCSAEEHAFKSESLIEAQDYAAAAVEAERALDCLPLMARTALTRGRALLHPALTKMTETGEMPATGLMDEALRAFKLAQRLDPESEEAKGEVESLQKLVKALAEEAEESCDDEDCDDEECHASHGSSTTADVIIVGAGAAGVGVALMLTQTFGLDASRVLLLERGETVGESFRRWPAEMRFISPSFNQQGWTSSFDLNSIAHGTSPAYSLHAEHPTGTQYAEYLTALSSAAELNVRHNTEVCALTPLASKVDELGTSGFEVRLRPAGGGGEEKRLRARYVIWAAGEFQFPRGAGALPGSELCLHNSQVRSWKELPGDDFVIIGGYESGVDAAVNLAAAGKRSTVVASTPFWEVATPDPSTELAPYTAARLRAATAASCATPPRLLAPLRATAVEAVDAAEGGGFVVRAAWAAAPKLPPKNPLRVPAITEGSGADAVDAPPPSNGELTEEGWVEDSPMAPVVGSEIELRTPVPPVLANGFDGSAASGVVRDLFAWPKDAKGCAEGAPLLTLQDESTATPGLFLAGPSVRHGELSFCFVYKFRQRFGVVADAICKGLGRDTTKAVEQCRKMNMFLDDFSCCKSACGEAC